MLDYHMHFENYYPFGRTPDTRPEGTDPMETIRLFAAAAEAHGVQEFAVTEHIYHFTQAREIVDKPWSDEKCFYDKNVSMIFMILISGGENIFTVFDKKEIKMFL